MTDMTAIEGSWHHVTGTYDGTNMKTYLDGIQIASSSQTGTVVDCTEALAIGGRLSDATPEYHYYGLLDDVQIFNYALSAQQVKTVMNEGAVRFGPITGSP